MSAHVKGTRRIALGFLFTLVGFRRAFGVSDLAKNVVKIQDESVSLHPKISPAVLRNLRLQVVGLLGEEVSHTGHVSPLGVSVNVHLDDSVVNGGGDLLSRRSGTSVEDQEPEHSEQVPVVSTSPNVGQDGTRRATDKGFSSPFFNC